MSHQTSTPLRGILSSVAGGRNSIGLVSPSEKLGRSITTWKVNTDQFLSGILESDQDTGHRFYDLSEVYSTEKILHADDAVGVTYYGPNLAQINRERERLLREVEDPSIFLSFV